MFSTIRTHLLRRSIFEFNDLQFLRRLVQLFRYFFFFLPELFVKSSQFHCFLFRCHVLVLQFTTYKPLMWPLISYLGHALIRRMVPSQRPSSHERLHLSQKNYSIWENEDYTKSYLFISSPATQVFCWHVVQIPELSLGPSVQWRCWTACVLHEVVLRIYTQVLCCFLRAHEFWEDNMEDISWVEHSDWRRNNDRFESKSIIPGSIS